MRRGAPSERELDREEPRDEADGFDRGARADARRPARPSRRRRPRAASDRRGTTRARAPRRARRRRGPAPPPRGRRRAPRFASGSGARTPAAGTSAAFSPDAKSRARASPRVPNSAASGKAIPWSGLAYPGAADNGRIANTSRRGNAPCQGPLEGSVTSRPSREARKFFEPTALRALPSSPHRAVHDQGAYEIERASGASPAKLARLALSSRGAALGASGCRVNEDDVHRWESTAHGPDKLTAVLLHDKYDNALRVEAALSLIRMKPRAGRRIGIQIMVDTLATVRARDAAGDRRGARPADHRRAEEAAARRRRPGSRAPPDAFVPVQRRRVRHAHAATGRSSPTRRSSRT